MNPNLNWKEISVIVPKINEEISGFFIDRIIIPSRPSFNEGYIKGEWVIRLTGRGDPPNILISIRPQCPYFALIKGKGPKAVEKASKSNFDLNLSKFLRGTKIESAVAINGDRIVKIRMKDDQSTFDLFLFLIPASPFGVLTKSTPNGQVILATSKPKRYPTDSLFTVPDGRRIPPDFEVRNEIIQDSDSYLKFINTCVEDNALKIRVNTVKLKIKHDLKQVIDASLKSKASLENAQKEPNWQYLGDLLKGSLYNLPELTGNTRSLEDFETGELVAVPFDPKLTVPEQLQKFFNSAKRKVRRIEESRDRLIQLQKKIDHLKQIQTNLDITTDWITLVIAEKSIGISLELDGEKSSGKTTKRSGSWLGRTFFSADGFEIWVGKSKEENLELTMKHARGNDLWMHLRGRPSAHVVIPVPTGKTIPLETLIDASNLCIFFSGGADWGKTEVDYTFRKYVKKIKDSTQVSYTSNKTLSVTPDKSRIDKLLLPK